MAHRLASNNSDDEQHHTKREWACPKLQSEGETATHLDEV
jgi:hypothetical protein